jgi:hypothetical protein
MQLYHYFVSQSSEFFRHNPLCCSQRAFVVVIVYFVMTQSGNFLIHHRKWAVIQSSTVLIDPNRAIRGRNAIKRILIPNHLTKSHWNNANGKDINRTLSTFINQQDGGTHTDPEENLETWTLLAVQSFEINDDDVGPNLWLTNSYIIS